MAERALSAGKIVGVLALLAAPIAIHAAIVTSRWTPLILAIPLLQLGILIIATGARHPARIKWLGTASLLLVAALLWAKDQGWSLSILPGISHAIINGALALSFGVTLLPGHVPLLTRVVVSIRGPLPRGLMIHTRTVTAAWSIFFAAQVLVSLILYIWAPLAVWSFFVNVLNLPLLLLMFALEYAYRVYRFPDYNHDSFADMMRIVAKTAKARTRQADSA